MTPSLIFMFIAIIGAVASIIAAIFAGGGRK